MEINRKLVKKNGFLKPYHPLQITTWILFGLQHFYFLIYIGLEQSLHKSQLAMVPIVVIHIALTLTVIKLAYEVTRCDAGKISKTEKAKLKAMANK